MSKLTRWAVYALASLLGLALIAVGAVYARSEYALSRTHPVAVARSELRLPTDSASILEGGRLAAVRGCAACHGDRLQGAVFFDRPNVARLVAPSLTRAVRAYSVPELELMIRHGVRPNGRTLWGMPSETYQFLSDEELVQILAYVRSLPAEEGVSPEVTLRRLGRLAVALSQLRPAAELVVAAPAPPSATPRGDPIALGHYLAITTCSECHGENLRGDQGAPSLELAVGYTQEEFVAFFRSGIAKEDRELRQMTPAVRTRFVNFTPVEMLALHAYLSAPGAP